MLIEIDVQCNHVYQRMLKMIDHLDKIYDREYVRLDRKLAFEPRSSTGKKAKVETNGYRLKVNM